MTITIQPLCKKAEPTRGISALAILLSAVLSLGCTKEIPHQHKDKANSRHDYQPSVSLRPVSLKVYEPNTMDWKEMAIGYDEANINYNKAKLYLSIGLTEVVKDPVIAEWIIENARQREDNVFHFDELFEKFPDTKAIMEATVDPLGEMTGWTFEEVEKQMQYDDFDIKASIYLTNTEIADGTLKPMVTPGYDIMEEDERHPSDVLLGWYIDEKNEVSRINLWKEVVDGVTAPIFAIDGRATNKPPLIIVTPIDTAEADTPRTANKFAGSTIILSQFQIGRRYENWGNSEFKLTGKCLFFPYAGTLVAPFAPNPTAYGRKFLRKSCSNPGTIDAMDEISVSKSTINSWSVVYTNKYFAKITGDWTNLNTNEYDAYYTASNGPNNTYYTNVNRKKLYFNTYENDGWGTSNKTLSPASINGIPLGLKGRMGTYNEWYQYNPYNLFDWLPNNTLVLDDYNNFNNTYWEKTRWSAPAKGGYTKYQEVPGCQ